MFIDYSGYYFELVLITDHKSKKASKTNISVQIPPLRYPVEALWLPLTPEHGFPSLNACVLSAYNTYRRRSPQIRSFSEMFVLKAFYLLIIRSVLSCKYKKPSADADGRKQILMLPTVALSTSGIKVEALLPLSHKAPSLFD